MRRVGDVKPPDLRCYRCGRPIVTVTVHARSVTVNCECGNHSTINKTRLRDELAQAHHDLWIGPGGKIHSTHPTRRVPR